MAHRLGRNHGIQAVEALEGAGGALLEVGVDGVLQDAQGVVRPLVQVHAHLLEYRVRDVVEGVVSQHSCGNPRTCYRPYTTVQAVHCAHLLKYQRGDMDEGVVCQHSCGKK